MACAGPPAPPECAPHRRESRTHLHTPICNAYYVRDRRMATGRSGRARRGSSTSAPTRNLATEEEVNFHLAPAPSSSTIVSSSSSFSSCTPSLPSALCFYLFLPVYVYRPLLLSSARFPPSCWRQPSADLRGATTRWIRPILLRHVTGL